MIVTKPSQEFASSGAQWRADLGSMPDKRKPVDVLPKSWQSIVTHRVALRKDQLRGDGVYTASWETPKAEFTQSFRVTEHALLPV